MVLVFYLMLSDPGVATAREEKESENASMVDTKNAKQSFHWTLKKVFKERNETYLLYCKQCEVYLSSLGFHCATCNVCVAEYRHHNLMLNNCITKRNLRSYFIFLVASLVLYSNLAIWIYLSLEFDTDKILMDMLGFACTSFYATYFLYNLSIELYFVCINDSYHFPFKIADSELVPIQAMARNFFGFLMGTAAEKNNQSDQMAELVDVSTQ